MEKLLQAIKDYQREVMSAFAHNDSQDYWRRQLNDAIHEAEGTTPAVPAATGHTPTPEEIAATEAEAARVAAEAAKDPA